MLALRIEENHLLCVAFVVLHTKLLLIFRRPAVGRRPADCRRWCCGSWLPTRPHPTPGRSRLSDGSLQGENGEVIEAEQGGDASFDVRVDWQGLFFPHLFRFAAVKMVGPVVLNVQQSKSMVNVKVLT